MTRKRKEEAKPRRMRLAIERPLEDQPTLIQLHRRIRGGEIALVLRPSQSLGLLVKVHKNKALVWESEISDAPQTPTKVRALTTVVQQVRELVSVPRKRGPTTLRGRWIGTLIIGVDGTYSVELKRRIASYGVLTITSAADGWGWTFQRLQKWFTEDGVESERGIPTLSTAIEAGLLGAMKLVRPACSMRDTRRRASLDQDYAERHPIRHPKSTQRGAREFVQRHSPAEQQSPTAKPSKKDCACKGATRRDTQPRSPNLHSPRTPPSAPEVPKNGEEAMLSLFVDAFKGTQRSQNL